MTQIQQATIKHIQDQGYTTRPNHFNHDRHYIYNHHTEIAILLYLPNKIITLITNDNQHHKLNPNDPQLLPKITTWLQQLNP